MYNYNQDLGDIIKEIRGRLEMLERNSQSGTMTYDEGTIIVGDPEGTNLTLTPDGSLSLNQYDAVDSVQHGVWHVQAADGTQPTIPELVQADTDLATLLGDLDIELSDLGDVLVGLNVDLGNLNSDLTDLQDEFALPIGTEKIAALAVTAEKIAALAVTAEKIAADAITANKIAADAVTTNKIAAGAITAAKLDVGAVTAEKIAADAVTAVKIAADALDGKTITGATIQTEATPNRGVKITSTGLLAYDSDGTETLSILTNGANRFKTVDTVYGMEVTLESGGVYLYRPASDSGGQIIASEEGLNYGAQSYSSAGEHNFRGQGIRISSSAYFGNAGIYLRQTELNGLTIGGRVAASSLDTLGSGDVKRQGVSLYDGTGWRIINNLLNGGTAAWGGSVWITRVANVVHCTGYLTITPTSAFIGLARNGTAPVTIPVNFQPVFRSYDVALGSAYVVGVGACHVIEQTSTKRLQLQGLTGNWASGNSISFALTWFTNETFPTEPYPGTAP